jgi:hypothetical protein
MMLETIIVLALCHLIGDYFLQSNFIATTKGQNWYHLFVHCALYCMPFLIVFGFTWQLAVIFVSHIIIDPLKVRYKKISYRQDQIMHYLLLMLYLIK